MSNAKKFLRKLSLILIFLFVFTGCLNTSKITDNNPTLESAEETNYDNSYNENTSENEISTSIDKDGYYYSLEDVTKYLQTYNTLPPNYTTKKDAKNSGWVAEKGNLWEVLEGAAIGGDVFGNYEELLPNKKDRIYYEADIDYTGGSRNAKRIVFSNDGLIFYTDDHYKSFEKVGEFDGYNN